MMTNNLFVIANVKQLRTGGSFRILLPFFRTFLGVGVLNSAAFNSFNSRVEFGTILEGLRDSGGGVVEPPPSLWSFVLRCSVIEVRFEVLTILLLTRVFWGMPPSLFRNSRRFGSFLFQSTVLDPGYGCSKLCRNIGNYIYHLTRRHAPEDVNPHNILSSLLVRYNVKSLKVRHE